VYDGFLGGKDNFEVDREIVRKVEAVVPLSQLAKANRHWLVRVVRFLAGPAGIDQFIDCGAGLPTVENTHEAAQRVNPSAKVLYVDNDPVVLAHGRALVADSTTHFVDADLTKPAELLSHPTITKNIDFDRPIGVIHCSTFHHVSDADKPHEIMATYVDAIPAGSYVAFAHFYDPADGSRSSEIARFIENVFSTSSMASGYFRGRAEIESFAHGLELLEPGVALVADWWPEGPRLEPLNDIQRILLGWVGRKP